MAEKNTVIVMGTMDTKGAELIYLAGRVEAAGCRALLMDVGVRNDSAQPVNIPMAEVARAGGYTAVELQNLPRGEAVEKISAAAALYLKSRVDSGSLHGVVGLGGSGGTTICTAALRGLPYGFPKLVVSTLASGNTRWHIGTSDIILMPSIVDIGGLNPLLEMVLNNAAHAIAGMALGYKPYQASGKKVVALTMYGTTTPGVSRAALSIRQAGLETWIFHASGIGGQTMERLITAGQVGAVVDMTLAEIGAHLVGGLHDGGPARLEAAGQRGIPQVIVPGAADTIVLPPRDQVPEKFSQRTLNYHNPTMTTMRTTPQENEAIARFITGKLNQAKGRVAVILPLGGVSSIDRPGKIFYDPPANQALFQTIKATLSPSIRLLESPHHIDDPEFADLVSRTLLELVA